MGALSFLRSRRHTGPLNRADKRAALADQFLAGDGIEIGALHSPLVLNRRARVRYVDRLTVEQLRLHYPELVGQHLIEPDVIDNAERLQKIADASQDFVISSHVMEHMEDPIGALKSYLRVLRPRGVIFLTVPDKRECFDASRPVTPFDHLINDHEVGTHTSRMGHFVEWAEFVEGMRGDTIIQKARTIEAKNYSIHFHVWEPLGFLEFLYRAKERYAMAFELEHFVRDPGDSTMILRRA